MSRYLVEEREDGFVVRGRLHPLDVPGRPGWLVDLAYAYGGGRRGPAAVVRGPCWLGVEGDPDGVTRRLVLCDCYGLVEAVARRLLEGWVAPPASWGKGGPDDQDHRGEGAFWLRDWLVKR